MTGGGLPTAFGTEVVTSWSDKTRTTPNTLLTCQPKGQAAIWE